MTVRSACAGLGMVVAAAATALPGSAQISDVSPICRDRPPATGESLFELEAVRPSRRGSDADRPASDLYCVDLYPTTRGGDAAGVVELRRPWSPFGVTVTAEGRHRHDLVAWLARLPDPSTLGPYTTYVAWATSLALDPVLKLGEVRNGRNELGEVALNKYLLWISAEASDEVTERQGPLVLRGRSPSSRMEAHDLLAFAPSAEEGADMATRPDPAIDRPTDRREDAAVRWVPPPGYEGVPMLPGVMEARPDVSPLRPGTAAERPEIPAAGPRQVLTLPDGGTLDLTAGFVRKTVRGRDMVMMAFNGQIPGPLLRVEEASTIFVDFRNQTSMPTAVHWHGIRLDNRYDGVPGVTQDAVPPGGSFRYRVHFPDPGIYWYHPHHREDVQQELGLAGNMLIEPTGDGYYNPVDREEIVMVDDLLLGPVDVVPFGDEAANFVLMGRFGNILLTNGEPEYGLEVQAGEVVRFHLTNVSNTRTFNLSFRADGAIDGEPLPIKTVASDVSRFERESMVESVVLAPAERYVVEVLFPRGGSYALVNRVQGINHRQGLFLEEATVLGQVAVSGVSRGGTDDVRVRIPTSAGADGAGDDEDAEGSHEIHRHDFHTLRTHDDVVADIDRYRHHIHRAPDHELVMTLEVDSLPMAIQQSMSLDWVYFNPVEWTGTMPVMNWATSGKQVEWVLRDRRSGAENMDIDWAFRVGDVVKIRITNDRAAFHAMQHPLHIHGQRFLVLEQNGVVNENMVWKDTVLLPAGSTTDILLELSNPGRWMVHCHIAEHLESGMKFVFDVEGSRP
ncbi:MAG: multicopper oxidase family protein [Longimicrobiales bacterium]|nr:multicopper oxidase family protein [Longimicrobiales bacterium]